MQTVFRCWVYRSSGLSVVLRMCSFTCTFWTGRYFYYFFKGALKDSFGCIAVLWVQLMNSAPAVVPALFCLPLTFICNSIKSQSDTFHFLFTSGQNCIKILLVSSIERCCGLSMCLCGETAETTAADGGCDCGFV